MRQKFFGSLIRAVVEDDGIVLLFVEQFQSTGDRGGMFHLHTHLGQDRRQQTSRLLIRAHQEYLQVHDRDPKRDGIPATSYLRHRKTSVIWSLGNVADKLRTRLGFVTK